jgi:hypothetical protein
LNDWSPNPDRRIQRDPTHLPHRRIGATADDLRDDTAIRTIVNWVGDTGLEPVTFRM